MRRGVLFHWLLRLLKGGETMNKEPVEPPRCSCSCGCPSGKWVLYLIAFAAIGFLAAYFLL